MTPPTLPSLRRLVPIVWLVVAAAATVLLVVLVLGGPHVEEVFTVDAATLAIAPIGLSFAVVGTVLARRLPGNPIGFLLGAFGTTFALGRAGEVYVAQGLVGGAWRPGATLVNWAVVYSWAFGQLALAMALLHFPTGSLPSRRWRPLTTVAMVLTGAISVLWVLLWPVRHDPTLLVATEAFPPAAALLASVVELPVLLTFVAAVGSLFLRYRTADVVGRLQLRWLLAAMALVVAGFAILIATGTNPSDDAPAFALVVLGLGLLAIPTAIAIAVLRYRLYEIDRLVSRTLAYALVSALVAAVYLLVVVAAQAVLRPVAGSSDLGVALATLAAAAAFRPILARVRRGVDRRFDRRAHDARETVEHFAERLRDEVDVATVATELRGTVRQVLHPASVSVWTPAKGPS